MYGSRVMLWIFMCKAQLMDQLSASDDRPGSAGRCSTEGHTIA